MSDQIISALIAAISAIVCCYIGIKLERTNNLKGLNIDVLRMQLDSVYSPIVKYLIQNKDDNFENTRFFIEKVFIENYDLVIPSLLEQLEILKSIDSTGDPKFAYFQRIIKSNYNWNKKLLGFPYDKAQIHKDDLPPNSKYEIIVSVIYGVCLSFGCISIFVAATPLFNNALYHNTNRALYSFCFIYSFFFLLWVATSAKKTK